MAQSLGKEYVNKVENKPVASVESAQKERDMKAQNVAFNVLIGDSQIAKPEDSREVGNEITFESTELDRKYLLAEGVPPVDGMDADINAAEIRIANGYPDAELLQEALEVKRNYFADPALKELWKPGVDWRPPSEKAVPKPWEEITNEEKKAASEEKRRSIELAKKTYPETFALYTELLGQASDIYYNLRTRVDYVDQSVEKVTTGRLPEGTNFLRDGAWMRKEIKLEAKNQLLAAVPIVDRLMQICKDRDTLVHRLGLYKYKHIDIGTADRSDAEWLKKRIDEGAAKIDVPIEHHAPASVVPETPEKPLSNQARLSNMTPEERQRSPEEIRLARVKKTQEALILNDELEKAQQENPDDFEKFSKVRQDLIVQRTAIDMAIKKVESDRSDIKKIAQSVQALPRIMKNIEDLRKVVVEHDKLRKSLGLKTAYADERIQLSKIAERALGLDESLNKKDSGELVGV